jgi:succinate dehydrogenase / fumarate reductase cytochrome b subunit
MPISPHLPIYKVQITSLLSTLHRLSELALYGTLLFNIILVTSALFWPGGTNSVISFFPCWLKIMGVSGTSCILAFYVLSSLRYIGWDFNWGFSLKSINWTGWIAVVMTPILGLIPLWAIFKKFIYSIG